MKVFSFPLITCIFFSSVVLPERHFPWLSTSHLKAHQLDLFWVFILMFWVVAPVVSLVFVFEEAINGSSLFTLSRPLRILWAVAIFPLCHVLPILSVPLVIFLALLCVFSSFAQSFWDRGWNSMTVLERSNICNSQPKGCDFALPFCVHRHCVLWSGLFNVLLPWVLPSEEHRALEAVKATTISPDTL